MNEQNPEQIVEDFAVNNAHRMTFRQVSTSAHSLMDELSLDENVNIHCIA